MAVTATVRTTDTFDSGPLNTTKWTSRSPSAGSGGGLVFDRTGFLNLKTSDVARYSGTGASWIFENLTPSTGTADVEVRTRYLTATSDGTFALFARNSQAGDGNRYTLVFNPGNGRAALQKVVGGVSSTDLVPDVVFAQSSGSFINAALRVWQENGVTNLAAKWWADGVAEPSGWNIETTDTSNPYLSGYHGAVGYPGGQTVSRDWQVDYLTVSRLASAEAYTRTVTDPVGVADAGLTSVKLPGVEDVMAVTDEVTREGSFVRDFDETLGPWEVVDVAAYYERTLDDAVGLTCDARPSAERPVVIDEGVGLADTREGHGLGPTATDAATPLEGPITVHGELDDESVGLADTALPVGEFVRAFDEALGPVEDAFLAREIPVDEVVGPTEQVGTAVDYGRDLGTDTAGLADDASTLRAFEREFIDGVGMADPITVGAGGASFWTAEVTDHLDITDAAMQRVSAWRVDVVDEAGLADAFFDPDALTPAVADWVKLTDEVFFRRDYGRVIDDSAGLGDDASWGIEQPDTWRRTITDRVRVREELRPVGRRVKGRGTAVLDRQRVGTAVVGRQQVATAELVED